MRLRLVVFLSIVAIGLGITGFFVRENKQAAAPRPTPAASEVIEETPGFDTTPLPALDLEGSPSPTAAPPAPAATVRPATRRPATARPATPAPTAKPKKTPPPFPFSPLPTRTPTAAPTDPPPPPT